MEPLEVGQTYNVSFYVSDADGGELEYVDCSTNNIGLLFLKEPSYYWLSFENNIPLLPTNYADVNYNEVLMDTTNWTLVDATFYSDDNYTHLVIGNFFDDSNTQIYQTYPEDGCAAMYYVDQVCVAREGDMCILEDNVEAKTKESFRVFPNPTNDIVNIEGNRGEIDSIQVFDFSGRLCIKESVGETTIDLSSLNSGVYLLVVTTKTNLTINRLLTKL